jgi:PKD repeat protein
VAEAGSPYAGFVGVPLAFSGAASTGTITGYAWTFGDSGAASGVAPSHTYASTGTFEVVLTVTGPGGTDADTTTATISVPALADAGGPYADTLGASIAFDGSGSSGATSYAWDFGDSSSGTGATP